MIPLTQLLIDNYSQTEIEVLRKDLFDSYKKTLLNWFYPFDLFIGSALNLIRNSEGKSLLRIIEQHFPVQCSLIHQRIISYPQIEKTLINTDLYQNERIKKIEIINQEFIDSRRPVVKITNNKENSFYLKPHSIEPSNHYYQISRLLGVSKSELSSFPNSFDNCSEFLLEEEVKALRRIQITSSELARQIGNTVALFQLLGTRDMHSENIRLSDYGLYILDSETLFQPSNYGSYGLKDSIKRTLLFENKKMKENKELGLSGLRETLDIVSSDCIKKEFFVNEICNTYHECWKQILKNKSSLIDYCNSKMSNLRVRCILGATSAYYSIIYREVLCSVSSKNKLRYRINNELQKIKGHNRNVQLIEYIINCLIEGQIPAFYNFANNRHLILGSGEIIENYFFKSVSSSIISRCESISNRQVQIEIEGLKLILRSQMNP